MHLNELSKSNSSEWIKSSTRSQMQLKRLHQEFHDVLWKSITPPRIHPHDLHETLDALATVETSVHRWANKSISIQGNAPKHTRNVRRKATTSKSGRFPSTFHLAKMEKTHYTLSIHTKHVLEDNPRWGRSNTSTSKRSLSFWGPHEMGIVQAIWRGGYRSKLQ